MPKSVKQKSTSKTKAKRLLYSKENVRLALDELKNQGAKIAEVARKYGIPESTLRAKKLGIYADKNPGPATVLTDDEEKELVCWISDCCDHGFPVTKAQIIESVRMICVDMKKINPFTNNTPGRSWYDRFLKRHPEVVNYVSEKDASRTRVAEVDLRGWFRQVSQYLAEKNILSIGPERIFNCDEAGMPLNPVPPPLITSTDDAINCINNNIENESVTVLIAANAIGDLAPTCVLFAGNLLPNNAVDVAPPDFAFGLSERGWMSYFYEYIVNVFEPWLQENNVERPVIMYVNGRVSHLTLHLSKFCLERDIVLVALYSNAARILQPLDMEFFRNLKVHWEKACEDFCTYSFITRIEKHHFAPLLKETFATMGVASVIETRFKKCGLYPFDVNVEIDDDKVVKRTADPEPAVSLKRSSLADCTVALTQNDTLKVFENLLTRDQLQAFQSNKGSTWRGINKDEGLFNVWYKLSHRANVATNTVDHLDP